MKRFAERIAKECRGRGGLMDFFEIRFDKAFAAIRTSALRQIGPASVDTTPLRTDRGDGLEVTAELEAAADFLGAPRQSLMTPLSGWN
jgi:hypothetical protein